MQPAFICLVISSFLFFNTRWSAFGHPQCLDFRGPFQPSSNLTFCDQYSDLGCCGPSSDDRIRIEYENIRSTNVSEEDWNRCKGFVKELLCQRCSPYAAHLYAAETSGRPQKVPGLCRDYCYTIYDNCYQLVISLDSSIELGSREGFCDSVALQDIDYCYPDLLENPILNGFIDPSVITNSSEGCLCLERVTEEKIRYPVFAKPAGDGSGRIFVGEQGGKVHIYDSRRKLWKDKLFFNATGKVAFGGYAGNENGLLGIAFHSNFSTNRRFFIFYTAYKESDDVLPPELEALRKNFRYKAIISELKVSEDNPDTADLSSEKVILKLFQPYATHNGGEIIFGDDGYLYTFHGDGGGKGDPLNAGQNKSLLFGKVLRLDVDSDPSQPYTIPPDNPFVGESGSRPEIYAYGIRNIWRCGIDRGDRITGINKGRIMCGDVGQESYEEVDLLKKGGNYGWNPREGFQCFNTLCGTIGEEELPLTAYHHSIGKSVVGGVFYRGCENPALNGQYIYGDYLTSRLFLLTESNGTWTNRNVDLCGSDKCQGHLENNLQGRILAFGEDDDGEIYALTFTGTRSNHPNGDGFMFKFIDPYTRNDPELCPNRNTENVTTTDPIEASTNMNTGNGVSPNSTEASTNTNTGNGVSPNSTEASTNMNTGNGVSPNSTEASTNMTTGNGVSPNSTESDSNVSTGDSIATDTNSVEENGSTTDGFEGDGDRNGVNINKYCLFTLVSCIISILCVFLNI